MAMTAAQRRKLDRDRKAAARAAAAVQRRPARIEQVYAAIVDANRFAIAAADRRVFIKGVGWSPINASIIIEVAVDILTFRHGYDAVLARKAVLAALAPNPAHRLSTYVPSLRPDPGLPRYRTRAPDQATVGISSGGTPVTSSGTVAV